MSRITWQCSGAICVLLTLGVVRAATADSFTLLHTFAESGNINPNELSVDGSTLYGTTTEGGTYNEGTLYSMNRDGSNFQILHNFESLTPGGEWPFSSLVQVAQTLYGSSNAPAAYSINKDGTNAQILSAQFPEVDGLSVIESKLYGGGSMGDLGGGNYGAIFSMNLDGSDLQNLHVFTGFNGDGYQPSGILTQVGSTLYGTTQGALGFGGAASTLFSMNLDGSSFHTLHTFNGFGGSVFDEIPDPHLTVIGSSLYGVTTQNFSSEMFAINLDGSNFRVLHTFASGPPSVLSDGGPLAAGLTLVGSTFYGVQTKGGSDGLGSLFSINPDGSNYQVLHSFTTTGGAYPSTPLTLVGSTLYGATENSTGDPNYGGSGPSTLFAYAIPEPSTATLLLLGSLGSHIAGMIRRRRVS